MAGTLGADSKRSARVEESGRNSRLRSPSDPQRRLKAGRCVDDAHAAGKAAPIGGTMRRSTSEPDVDPRRRSKSAWVIGVDDSDDDDNPHGIWVVADPCSPCFGQKYSDIKAIAEKGVTCGQFCLVPGEAAGGAGGTRHGGEGAILLQQARSRSNFMSLRFLPDTLTVTLCQVLSSTNTSFSPSIDNRPSKNSLYRGCESL